RAWPRWTGASRTVRGLSLIANFTLLSALNYTRCEKGSRPPRGKRPAAAGNVRFRLRPDGLLALARVERVAQAITEQIKSQHRQEDHDSRRVGDVREGQDVLARVGQHVAPRRRGSLDA